MAAQPPSPLRPGHDLLRDRVLLVLVGFTLFGCLSFLAFPDDTVRKIQLYWAFQVPLDAALAIGAWRLRRLAQVRYRRFWTYLGLAGSAFVIGDSCQFVVTLVGPTRITLDGGSLQSAFFVVGTCCVVLACLLFPQNLNTGREKLIFWLDSTTVLVGGGVLAWCFAVNPIDEHTDRVTASITAALVIVAAFSATKVALCPEPPMDRLAAWPMASAPFVQTLSAFAFGALQPQEHAYVFAVRLLPSLLVAMGPRIQEITVRITGNLPRPKRRPYSLLPYGMVALTFVMLVMVLPDQASTQLWGAIIGIIVITALVTWRQLIAFQDNTVLIRRLDVALGG